MRYGNFVFVQINMKHLLYDIEKRNQAPVFQKKGDLFGFGRQVITRVVPVNRGLLL